MGNRTQLPLEYSHCASVTILLVSCLSSRGASGPFLFQCSDIPGPGPMLFANFSSQKPCCFFDLFGALSFVFLSQKTLLWFSYFCLLLSISFCSFRAIPSPQPPTVFHFSCRDKLPSTPVGMLLSSLSSWWQVSWCSAPCVLPGPLWVSSLPFISHASQMCAMSCQSTQDIKCEETSVDGPFPE